MKKMNPHHSLACPNLESDHKVVDPQQSSQAQMVDHNKWHKYRLAEITEVNNNLRKFQAQTQTRFQIKSSQAHY